jgi:quercetin dioxygenase-like cupin family protein
VLAGMFEVTLADCVKKLEAGDFYYFPPNSSHGLRCAKGPGQFLIIFAPPR